MSPGDATLSPITLLLAIDFWIQMNKIVIVTLLNLYGCWTTGNQICQVVKSETLTAVQCHVKKIDCREYTKLSEYVMVYKS